MSFEGDGVVTDDEIVPGKDRGHRPEGKPLSRKRTPSRRSIGFYQKLENDDIFFLASGLAFNLLICFIPLLLVILSILGFFLHSSQDILGYVQVYLEKMLPNASSRLTSNILNLIKDRKLVGLIGFLGLLWAATRLLVPSARCWIRPWNRPCSMGI